jgi:transposase InsO family protein
MSISEFKKRCTATAPSLKEGWTPQAVDLCRVMVGGVNAKKLSLESDEEVEAVVAKDLSVKQQQDETIGPVYKTVSEGKRLSRKEGKALSRSSKLLLRNFGKLFIRNGVLMRKTVKYEQVVLPSDFYHLVYVELHEKLAHLGVEKVVDLAQRRFYWPKMADDIKNYIQKKCRCVANKKPNQPEKAKLVPIQAMYPFQMVSIDYMHLDPCKGNYKYAMVVTDHFTRFAQVYATKSKSSKAAAQKLYDEFMMQFGFPERLHHDQGPEFNSDLFKQLERLTGIKGSNTTPYHPQGDGQAERFNRTLCNMLKCLPEVAKKDWKSHLPKLAFAYNSSINKTTGFSPFRLMFNRESRLPIDQMFEGVRGDERLGNQSHEQYVSQWEKAMQEAVEIAKKNIGKSAEYSKRYYDKKVRAVEIVVGDQVLMKNVRERGGTGKLRSYWEETLFTVIERRENVPVYTIKNMKKPSDIRVVHRNLLLKCDELPLDIFDKEVEKTVKPAKQGKVRKKPEIPCECPTMDTEEEEDADIAVMIHHQETLSEPRHQDDSSESAVEEAQPGEEDEELMFQETEEEANEEEEQADEASEGDEVADESSDDEDLPIRRSTRNRTAAKRFTYSTIGGDPTLTDAVT